jgi:hypothetical protein
MELTLQAIEQQLNDGIERTPEEHKKCLEWLAEFCTANQISLKELNELCWDDSDWVFSQIFG